MDAFPSTSDANMGSLSNSLSNDINMRDIEYNNNSEAMEKAKMNTESKACLSSYPCSRNRVTPLNERLTMPKKSVFPLPSSCPHLLCNVQRMVKILEFLDLCPVHSACQEQDQGEGKKFPSHFVVDMLIRSGANLRLKNSDGK